MPAAQIDTASARSRSAVIAFILPRDVARPLLSLDVSERRAEMLAYLVAVVILVGGGMLVRTPILNWISGPAIVVVAVAVLTPRLSRSARPKARRSR